MANNSNNLSKLSKIAGSSSNNNVIESEPVNEIKPAPVDTNKYNEYIENHPIDNDVDIEELAKEFVGNKYEIFKNSLFNVPAFFFTSLYMFYRKMYLYAFLTFILFFVVINYFKGFIAIVIFHLVIGFIINKLYLSFARRKVAKIKANNPRKTIPYLKVMCSSSGGVSIGGLVVGIVLEFIVALIISIVMVIAGIAGVLSKALDLDNWVKVVDKAKEEVKESK